MWQIIKTKVYNSLINFGMKSRVKNLKFPLEALKLIGRMDYYVRLWLYFRELFSMHIITFIYHHYNSAARYDRCIRIISDGRHSFRDIRASVECTRESDVLYSSFEASNMRRTKGFASN